MFDTSDLTPGEPSGLAPAASPLCFLLRFS
nr:MAG TPA: hypothetical protein [Caudoviricetes sp.]